VHSVECALGYGRKGSMFLGISSFTYGWAVGVPGHVPLDPLTAFDLIHKTIALNLKCVQIGDNLPLHKLDRHQRDDLKSIIFKNDLRLEVGARKLTTENLDRYISIAANFGSPLLRFVVDGVKYKPEANDIVTVIRNAMPDLKKAGITLGIENHDRFKASELATIMDSINDEQVGICLDCVNSLGAGEGLDHVTSVLLPYTVNLHIKDYTIRRLSHNMGFVVNGMPTGTGMIDVPALLDQLKVYDRCKSAILEQWVTPELTIAETILKEERWAMESLGYLQQLPHFHHNHSSVKDKV